MLRAGGYPAAGGPGPPPPPQSLKGAEDTRLEVTIFEARLAKIFDQLKGQQDVYVQLVRVASDGTEKEFARTRTCKQGDLNPIWREKFIVRRLESRLLRLRVYIEHFWRQDKVCGECEIYLEDVLLKVRTGHLRGDTALDQPLSKRDQQTGSLRIAFAYAPDQEQTSMVLPNNKGALAELLNRPEELEESVRARFRKTAPLRNGRQCVGPKEMTVITEHFAQRLGIKADQFGEVQQMFWRYENTGHGVLYEEEAVKLFMAMLRKYRDATMPPDTRSVQLGRAIRNMKVSDSYDVEKELGRGGQGIVYLAKDKKTRQQVVVKMYGKTNQKEAIEDITQEFELLMSLKHPKIARVFDIFQDWQNVYIVQEPYFGGDLTTAVQNATKAGVEMTERWLADVVLQVLTGVEFLHNNGVVHSDLKEPNVMVAGHSDWQRPQIIVIDFGLANKFSSKSGVGGTPGYMPPEVWDYGLWTPRGDVFSLGVMLFVLRTGRQPFVEGKVDLQMIAEATRKKPIFMERGSQALKRLTEEMLNKAFLQRPTVSQIMQDEWFKSDAAGPALDMQALEKLATKQQRTDLYRALLADIAARQNLGQLRELNDLFIKLDVNNDGQVSAEELRGGLAGAWEPGEVERLVAVLGIDGGGEISYDEFMGELLAAKAPEEGALLQRLFEEVDTERRGYLGHRELEELANRPGFVGLFGSQEAALARLREMDRNRNGRVTFEDFRNAVQGRDPARRETRAPPFREGQAAEYFSRSHGTWMECKITAVDASTGAVQVSCKPGAWIEGKDLQSLLRPIGSGKQRSGTSRFCEGQSMLLWSTSYSTWIPCRITRVDEATGAVQVDQKPNYWFRGDELATRLKPARDEPESSSSAAKAGVGRQLLDGAFHHLR